MADMIESASPASFPMMSWIGLLRSLFCFSLSNKLDGASCKKSTKDAWSFVFDNVILLGLEVKVLNLVNAIEELTSTRIKLAESGLVTKQELKLRTPPGMFSAAVRIVATL